MARLFLSPPHMTGKEQTYIAQAFESNYIAPLGPFVERFEGLVRFYTGAPFALATSSGTAAIHLALRVLGVTTGDIVLASTFTFIGSVAPIIYQGAEPYFIDSETQSWNLDPDLLLQAIKKAPRKPKALVVTHLYGQCAEIGRIATICRDNDIALIEDAAESLGAEYDGRQSGTFGDFGIYSFNGNKILSTSGGGMLVARSEEHIRKAQFYATQAKEATVHYEHEEVGYNYRMSNILAAIGVAQMEVLEERVAKRRRIFAWYQEHLGRDGVEFMPELEGAVGNRWLTTVQFPDIETDKIRLALEEENIESRPLWKPMHLQPVFKHGHSVLNGVSEDLFTTGLCLPSGTQMEESDIVRISQIIRRTLGGRR